MLEIYVEGETFWNEELQEFYDMAPKTFHFEYSLAAISKWEMKWHIPYLTEDTKTQEQVRDFIRCMCLDEEPPDELHLAILSTRYAEEFNAYTKDPMTATTIKSVDKFPSHSRNNIQTNELIYHLMTVNNIPFECDKWHFNRLMTLIRVCNEQNGEKKPMTKRETLEYQAALNKARRAKKGM